MSMCQFVYFISWRMILKVIFWCSFLQITFGYSTRDSCECRDFNAPVTYPAARRNESVIDDHFGVKIADPYRWLESPDTDETKQFIDAQNQLSQLYVKNCQEWDKINKELTAVYNYPKYSGPQRQGKYYFSTMNSGLQNQAVIYKQTSLDDEPSVLLDPNKLSTDGKIAVTGLAFSEDGSLLAYSTSQSGSDWNSIKIRNVETGEDYPDTLERIKFSVTSWTYDNKGFFYARYPNNGDGSETDKNENQKLYYHRIGEDQKKDTLAVEFPNHPSWRIMSVVSHGGKYAMLFISGDGDDNLVYYVDLEKEGPINGKLSLNPIITEFKASYTYVTNIGSSVVLRTNKNASNYRLVTIDLENPSEENWTTLIQENPKDVLQTAAAVANDKLLIVYFQDVKSILQVHSLKTGEFIRKFALEIGDISEINGGYSQSEFFIQLKSFLTPGTIYRYDFTEPNADLTVYREVKLNLKGFNKSNFEMKQVFYPSLDGTQIPMYIVQKKSSKKVPKPVLLYGYGGFSISTTPSFKPYWLFFLNSFDGILAVANIRGGGEYGDKWHDGGRLLNKQNVFDDFQYAAKYLVEEKYTERKMLAIHGRSNGGLLVGACINQRPDLFGAAVAQVGVMDMLRFHKFTIGAAWISDYGNPDEKVHFDNIRKYSPLHNVQAPNATRSQYPPTLIMTADHDDRVSPLHSLKFAATIQNAIQKNEFQKNAVVMRVYSDAGHGGGKPTSKAIDEDTDVLTFLYRALRIQIDI